MVATPVVNTPPSGGSGVTFNATDMTIPAIAGYVPLMGDIVCVFGNINSQASTIEANTWSFAGVNMASDTNRGFLLLHNITPAEALAGTNAWTVAGLFTGAAGRGIAVVVRGSSGPDRIVSAISTGGTTAQPPTITPEFNGSLVFAYVAPDNIGAAVGEPGAGWVTVAKSTNTAGVTSQSLLRRTALTTAGVPVDTTNAQLGFGSSDEAVMVTLALKSAVSGSGFFACL